MRLHLSLSLSFASGLPLVSTLPISLISRPFLAHFSPHFEIAWRLAAKGGNVVLGDISADAGKRLADDINAKHSGRAAFAVCNVTSKKDQEALFALAKTTFGSVDVRGC